MTRYVIRRERDGRFLTELGCSTLEVQWAEGDKAWVLTASLARRFDFMTLATHYALTVLHLGGTEFRVDPI